MPLHRAMEQGWFTAAGNSPRACWSGTHRPPFPQLPRTEARAAQALLKPSFLSCFFPSSRGLAGPQLSSTGVSVQRHGESPTFLPTARRCLVNAPGWPGQLGAGCPRPTSPTAARVCGSLLLRGRTGARLDAAPCQPGTRSPTSRNQLQRKKRPSLLLVF